MANSRSLRTDDSRFNINFGEVVDVSDVTVFFSIPSSLSNESIKVSAAKELEDSKDSPMSVSPVSSEVDKNPSVVV